MRMTGTRNTRGRPNRISYASTHPAPTTAISFASRAAIYVHTTSALWIADGVSPCDLIRMYTNNMSRVNKYASTS